jgi:hypothetical protein
VAAHRLAPRPRAGRGHPAALQPLDAGRAVARVPDAAQQLDVLEPGAQARPLPSGRSRPLGWVAAAGAAARAQVQADRLSEASPPPLAKQR